MTTTKVEVPPILRATMRERKRAIAKVKSLGHDPGKFCLKRGVYKSYCRNCLNTIELLENYTLVGRMLTERCVGQAKLRV